MLFKRFLQLCIFFLLPGAIWAQVTTGSISGIVTDVTGKPLDGVSVKAVLVTTGFVSKAISQSDGAYTLPNLQAGGPYTITFSYVGLTTQTFNDVYVDLGSGNKINGVMQDPNIKEGATVTSRKNSLISKNNMGMSVQIGQKELTELPTVNRSINDFARLSPIAQVRNSSADGSPMGISFGGQSTRYNQFTIDGANSTDIFGLSSNGTNGGQAGVNPIPLDAIQSVQVVMSPYDITYGGFTGGGLNAVTKSGTNQMHGSAYGYTTNQNWTGNSADDKSKFSKFHSSYFGGRLGGAIVKNKLFYFVNYEGYRRSQPVNNQPGTGGSNINTATLDQISNFMKTNYNYDPGAYNGLNNTINSNTFFARVDWNINDKNKLMIRNSYVEANNYSLSDGNNSMSFENNGYTFKSKTNSTVAQLTSNISPKLSNLLRATYTSVRDKRVLGAGPYPSITINDGNATYNVGSDYSSQANSLNQNVFTLTDNLTYYAGKHTLTLGTHNEFVSVSNVFYQGIYGGYTYNSLNHFLTDSIDQYQTTYRKDGTTKGVGPKGAQFGLYIQDKWDVTSNFTLNYGVRFDMPVYFNKADANDQFNASQIAIDNNVNNTLAPKSRVMIAPRIGFNWDIKGNGMTQLRGGAGIFTGRVPLVWLSNQYGNTGSTIIKENITKAYTNSAIKFDPSNPYRTATAGNSQPATEVDVTDRNFKNPQTFRANLAIDQKLPWGLVGTIEGIYTKTVHDILYKDLNLQENASYTLDIDGNTRPFYNNTRIDKNYTNVMYLTNTSMGYSYTVYARLQKTFTKGWMGSISYSYGNSYSLNDGTSSTAYSNWRYAYTTTGNLNNLQEARNNYSQGGRIMAYVAKVFNYGKDNAWNTNIGLFFTGQSGQTFSYLFYGDVNGDNQSTTTFVSKVAQDVMFVPNQASDFKVASQYDDWMTYVNGNKYLKDNLGKYTKRNASRLPWENHFDLKLSQGYKLGNGNKITVECNIMNVSNLLNDHWGRSYYLSNQSASPLTIDHFNTNGTTVTPIYTFNSQYGNNSYTGKPWSYSTFGARWNMQLGLRYEF
ncbi:TonB-dependent receptor [Rhizosphaericola mali]|uniref:TonB-dependent receptor n=1 Tax=Rhizosphaericola mali TaxID=2545455 RepID=A0A5P2G1D5_9BACT|nr:carboxypeptidase regulatory-like domain-containing protein [Rhizosphaericola mali]QES88987.1 TonB-dependent receptor [Rhizosphaericola mali]